MYVCQTDARGQRICLYYDSLNRLTSATYSDGRSFQYTYDPAGNVLQLEQNLGPGTVTTVYAYDAANQLDTAQQGSTTWQYTYDANGSLISDGVKTYTYDSANRLIEVSDQLSVTNLFYNGLGQRLSMDAAGVIAHYVMDGDRPLTAETGGNTNFYLYGLGAIGEKTTAWSYSLPDGSNTPRQLSDVSGDITLTSRYTPWGDTLDTYGTGSFTFGYFGGVMDAATGLLYVGNGQYYDPSTGRFLTRDVNPNSTNPYVPWNPIGVIVGPLGLIALVFGRRKKGSKAGTFLVLLLVVGSVGMTLAACGPAPVTQVPNPNATAVPSSDTAPSSNPNPNPTQTPGPDTIPSDLPSPTSSPTIVVAIGDCATAIFNTPTQTGTPTPTLSLEQSYRITFKEDGAKWTAQDKDSALRAVVAVAEKFALFLGGTAVDAWARTYEYMEFQMGNCSNCTEGGTHAGYTNGEHDIDFAGISDDPEKGRNLVVHELGHAFKWLLYHKTGTDVYTQLDTWQQTHPYFPNRPTFNGSNTDIGGYYGFYTAQNQIAWQVSLDGAYEEEFADQFLGWMFDRWQGSDSATLHPDGQARKDWMDANMPSWIISAGS